MIQPPLSVAIIGAGISGLIAGQNLHQSGLDVTIFEKSRGFGGRMATRRADAILHFDHGAQYFTARTPHFRRQVEAWITRGAVGEWTGRIIQLERGIARSTDPAVQRFVAIPGMSAIGKELSLGLTIKTETRIVQLTWSDEGWRLLDHESRMHGPFDQVLLAIPAGQAADLLPNHPFGEQARQIEMTPCWAVLVAFAQPMDVSWDGAFVEHSAIAWAARNSSKPARPRDPDAWVLHATSEWTRDHLDMSKEHVINLLLKEFGAITGAAPAEAIHVDAHRWMFSAVPHPAQDGAWYDTTQGLGMCGDWLAGARIEGAYLSGLAAADMILRRSGKTASFRPWNDGGLTDQPAPVPDPKANS